MTIDRSKSKSSLFLMEMIVTLLFFSAASAICVQLFAQAHILSRQAEELNMAVAISQSYAEAMRGTDGSIESISVLFPDAERISNQILEQYYDGDYQKCPAAEACYVVEVTLSPTNAFQIIHTRVLQLETREIIYELTATKYINTPLSAD